MDLLRNGMASTILALCVFALCALLWFIAQRAPVPFAAGCVVGVSAARLCLLVHRWWHADDVRRLPEVSDIESVW